ncbi:MAG: hypothetical protein JST64_12075 [Actinobacteria bacterium]|nr:hypothetical protein [Actinomycetota bacterium]
MFGLLGILVTIAIMALLSVKVLDAMGSSGSKVGPAASAGPTGRAPSSTTPGTVELNPAGQVDRARAARCVADRQTVTTAAESYRAMNGSYPPDVATLQAAGLVLSDHPLDLVLHVEGDTLSVVGTGPCTGR